VLHRARQANTQYTIVSPIAAMMPRGGGEPVAIANNATSIASNLRPPWRDEVVAQWRSKASE